MVDVGRAANIQGCKLRNKVRQVFDKFLIFRRIHYSRVYDTISNVSIGTMSSSSQTA